MSGPPAHVVEWAQQRARLRAAGDYAAADALRDRIAGAGWRAVDSEDSFRLEAAVRFEAVIPARVADRSAEPDGVDASVLLLLEDHPATREDATRCLSGVLAHHTGTAYELILLDNGAGGEIGDWAADVARNPGVTAVHLAKAVGFAEARALQHRVATGGLLVWLDTGVEPTGDLLSPLIAAFANPAVGLAGRWGGDLGPGIDRFANADPAPAGAPLREVHAVWGYLLALRRRMVTDGAITMDPAFAFYRNADADVAFQVRSAGRRVVLLDLPAVQHAHRAYADTPATERDRASRRNYRRLLDRWRPQMERLAGG
ncbi:hypothetical protein BH23ACT8_BH23ACT8_18380 [soil metagenome]